MVKGSFWNSKRKDKLIALNLPEPQSDEILEINKQIAYHMHSDKTVIIAKKNFRNIVSKMHPQLSYKDVNAVCNYILETYFENRIEDEFYSYQHRRYQEYFYTLSLYDFINTMLVIYEKNKYLLIMNFLMNLFCHILKIEVIKKNSYHSQ